MHEFSIVNALLDLCEKNAKENSASQVLKVEIKIGKLSGIEPHLLKTAFDTFKEGTLCENAELLMHLQDLVLYCSTCKSESVLEKNEFYCPKCNSVEVSVLDGEEMYLMRLEME
ncbi:hydrogenase maturation nickel metallochaperone HypA [Sulfurospirillum sp. T05]|uniref:Hydrogenase maturation factor HypA n=1 Tax=Sulfurospirillum tamanense TaxID=2813362 RepID=A0ABS2WR60_9BACT|nr:hydrogenase maturation nickel metallochaperone HypA [Sulfurospirillum tamanensis]MBN2964151.1 hydrogenase maturation nickel metallochaperone HypA [Sulfurospirillum tamanensis]